MSNDPGIWLIVNLKSSDEILDEDGEEAVVNVGSASDVVSVWMENEQVLEELYQTFHHNMWIWCTDCSWHGLCVIVLFLPITFSNALDSYLNLMIMKSSVHSTAEVKTSFLGGELKAQHPTATLTSCNQQQSVPCCYTLMFKSLWQPIPESHLYSKSDKLWSEVCLGMGFVVAILILFNIAIVRAIIFYVVC